jgi:aspartate ammonia-lyase
MRTERDIIGEMEVPRNALYGIHALRARENFPADTAFPVEWYKAVGLVKAACYETYMAYKMAVGERTGQGALPYQFIGDEILKVMVEAAYGIAAGENFVHFIVPGISGGAGTSINMNINEIIANSALIKLGKSPGECNIIDPIEDANVFQSTNDVIPTSLKVAVMFLLSDLEKSINGLRTGMETLETRHRSTLRAGYTQMQEAVPTSFGKLFSTYSEALSRDWWRISKCFERIKTVNLGGSAIGTGVAVPRFFIMEATSVLQKITGLPVTRSENLSDATSNLDGFVEVSAIMKSYAINLEKMASDIRLLASDIGPRELILPRKQAGSSIMPAKINPVIPEFVITVAHRVYANDILITSLCGQGCLELNAYLPGIGISLIENLKLLIAAGKTLGANLLSGLEVDAGKSMENLLKSPSLTTILIPVTGYYRASELAKLMRERNLNILEANLELGVVDDAKLKEMLKPENLLKLGFTLSDLEKES